MSMKPAHLSHLEGSRMFVPFGGSRSRPDEYAYVEEEWLAGGEVDGHRYLTTVLVRRPSDPGAFSGTLIVEPIHAMGAAPVWIYTSTYQMRSGHASAYVCSQKSALDAHVKPHDPERYRSLEIWSAVTAGDIAGRDRERPSDPDGLRTLMERMRQVNAASTPILAQVGAALRTTGPLAERGVERLILAGHSQTGGVVTDYVLNGHDAHRLPDGRPIYDGFFPSGAPGVRFGPRDVPLVQTLSEGDIAHPRRFGSAGRTYRRDDSDAPGDRYRLYELAGVAHMGTRYPPYDDPAMWVSDRSGTAGRVHPDARMNSLPHGELFSMTLDHLVRWVSGENTPPPRASRIEVGESGRFAKDAFGNSRGGVRCAQMDVPRLTYFANPGTTQDGMPARGVVGYEEPLPEETLTHLYGTHASYVATFERRLDALVSEGWLLTADVDEMRAEAANAKF